MAKHEFKWYDGRVHEFEDFEPLPANQSLYIEFPSYKRRHYNYLLVSKQDRDDYDNCSNYRPGGIYNAKRIIPDEKKVRVGILRDNSGEFPAGCYIPYKLVQQTLVHLLEDLTGDFILNDKYTKKV